LQTSDFFLAKHGLPMFGHKKIPLAITQQEEFMLYIDSFDFASPESTYIFFSLAGLTELA